MALDAWDTQATETDVIFQMLKYTGNGTSQPTKVYGRNITLNRTGVGIIDVTWTEMPGVYGGLAGWAFEAATQSGVKGFTVVPGTYSNSTRTLTINTTNAGETLVDLSTVQQLSLTFWFKRTNA